jgi:phosphate transport system protein
MQETRQSYRETLASLREDVLFMGEVVAERLRMGLEALEHKDEALAHEVIEGDGEVNDLYMELEADCIDLLALQQPVAGDLRLIAASFKIITDLERIGDLATNLGQYTLEAREDRFPEVDVRAIGDVVLESLERALVAYEREDVDACLVIAEADDRTDEMCEQATDTVVRELIDTENVTDGEALHELLRDVSRILLTIRDLERVGDHTVNVAARTLYMIENDDRLLA